MSDKPLPEETGLHAQLEWDEQGQPLSRQFGDIYFSRANGLEETRHVFLQHNHLAERFAGLDADVFTLGETGFGSGLNFLAAWQLWDQLAPTGACLHFVTTEKYPLQRSDLERALALWPELDNYARQLIDSYPVFIGEAFHRLVFAQGRVRLTLIIGDAAEGLARLRLGLAQIQVRKVDAWFLDGFAPAKNPQMWSPALFTALGCLSGPGTTAATFSAAGVVKQGLRSAGFTVKRVPGYGRKREMVAALVEAPVETTAAEQQAPAATPWHLMRHYRFPDQRQVLVIGGGLAGCHSARALAERGWQVTLVEAQSSLAAGASGNPQGMVYGRLSPKQETLAAFNLACLQYALNFYAPYWAAGQPLGEACGLLQLQDTEEEARLQQALVPLLKAAEHLARPVSAEEASAIAGLRVSCSGIYFPGSGWLSPPVLCQKLAEHPLIRVVTGVQVRQLEQLDRGWRLHTTDGQSLKAPVVVIANARDALNFEQSHHLPLKSIRGQVTFLPPLSTPKSRQLKTVICGEGYLAPPQQLAEGQWQQCLGASFNLKDTSQTLNPADHSGNLQKLMPLLPELAEEWSQLKLETLDGRAGFRCTSPDYLPLVGPVPVEEDFARDYEPLRKDARKPLPLAGSYWPGLYLSLAYGSRGLAYTPLCAELLAAQINNEPLPLAEDLVAALNPARFLIRDLKRNRRQ